MIKYSRLDRSYVPEHPLIYVKLNKEITAEGFNYLTKGMAGSVIGYCQFEGIILISRCEETKDTHVSLLQFENI